tara:strand:- start:523 stop:1125 length:603 start_codon:yes stop_codon:yes gene_type:complete
MTYKPRDLGAALGRSIPNEGRVVIYKPKPQKGKKMAFGRSSPLGKAINVSIPVKDIDNDIRVALENHFKNYGGYDSYGKADAGYTAYAYPSPLSVTLSSTGGRHGEILGQFGEWVRFQGPQPAWVKKGQVTEIDQKLVDNEIKYIVNESVRGWLDQNKGVKLEKIMSKAGVIGAVTAIGASVKHIINNDPWFQSFGLKVS